MEIGLNAAKEWSAETKLAENIPQSGNLGIDALLTGCKWNDKTITYSFFDGRSYYSNKNTLSEVSDVLKGYVRHILEDLIEPLINLDFVGVSDAGGNYGQLRYLYEKEPIQRMQCILQIPLSAGMFF